MGKGKRKGAARNDGGGGGNYGGGNFQQNDAGGGNQGFNFPHNPDKPYQVPLAPQQSSNLRQQIISLAGTGETAFGRNSATPCTMEVTIMDGKTTPQAVIQEFTGPSTEIPHKNHVARLVREKLQCRRKFVLRFLELTTNIEPWLQTFRVDKVRVDRN